jgi:multimeric flavodoxin WrbA
MHVCFINGSPKTGESTSHYFIESIQKMLADMPCVEIKAIDHLQNPNTQEAFSAIVKADVVVFVFPLYIDSIPSSLLEFLYVLESYINSSDLLNIKMPRCYAVVNEGFYGGTQNINALNNIQYFCRSVGFHWRFGVGIGAGEYLRSTKDIPLNHKSKIKVYDQFKKIADDILIPSVSIQTDNFADPQMTKRFFMLMGAISWQLKAKKNGLRLSQLKAKPFIDN